MSRYNNVVPVPLGEIRCLDGKLVAAALPGTLVTAVSDMAGGDATHAQPGTGVGFGLNAKFTANAAENTRGVMIVMNQEELVLQPTSKTFAKDDHVRAHVLKSGEECTVIMAAAAVIASGNLLCPAAGGKVEKLVAEGASANGSPMFSAIETCASTSTGDDLRILARVL